MKVKTLIWISVVILILLGLSYYLGNSVGKKIQKDHEIKTKIEYIKEDNINAEKKIDSLNKVIVTLNKKDSNLKEKEIEYREVIKHIVIPKPTNPDCDEVYASANKKIDYLNETITTKDSIESNLRVIIYEKDGLIVQKDRIIDNKNKEIELVKELNKPRKKRFVVGLNVSTGYGITSSQNNINLQYVPVQVGIGITYKIFEF